MQKNKLGIISGFLVFLVLTGFVLAYPIQFNLQSNLPATNPSFTTFVTNCADAACSSFVNGTERTINSGGNLNVYAVPGPGTVTWLELDYKDETLVPHIYRFQASDSSVTSSFTVNRDFSKKSNCEANINSVQLSSNAVGESTPLTASVNVQSAISFPKDQHGNRFDFSMIPIPSNLKEIYSSLENVTFKVRNSANEIVFTKTNTVNPWINKTETTSFDFTPTREGNYTVEIETEVTDSFCSSSNKKTQQVNFSVTDSPPVAKAGGNKTVTQGDVVTFDGSQSVSADAALLFLWDFGDQTFGRGQVLNHTYQNPGTYTVKLEVTDLDLQVSTDIATVVVNPINHFPVADFDASVSSLQEGQSVQFTDKSTSADGFKSRLWEFGDGSNSTDTTPAHVFSQQGNFVVKLTVTDNNDDSNSKTANITVTDTEPTVNFVFSSSPVKNQPVQFNDTTTSYDQIKTRFWEFGDGSNSTDTNPVHTFASASTFNVKLTVIDNDGQPKEKTSAVVVADVQPTVTRELSVSQPTLSKPSVYLFDSITVKTNVSNLGSATESVTVKLKEGSVDLESKTVSLNAGETKEVQFTWTPSTTGSRTLTVEAVALQGETNSANNVQTKDVKVLSAKQNLVLTFAYADRYPGSVQATNSDFYVWVNIENKGSEALTDVEVVLDVPLPIVSSADGSTNSKKIFNSIPSTKTQTYLWKVASGSVPNTLIPKVYIGSGSDKVEVSRSVSIQ